ncbi:MAG: hypothetical protein QGG71_19630, partial [Pirellulaceae bacterium]|nr:hypothetical protein [Pirellulaceae bacterium]
TKTLRNPRPPADGTHMTANAPSTQPRRQLKTADPTSAPLSVCAIIEKLLLWRLALTSNSALMNQLLCLHHSLHPPQAA